MEIKATSEKVITFLKKYKFVVLILLIGLVLMLIPEGNDNQQIEQIPAQESVTEEIPFEEKLANILSQIQGAGRVEVMLTISEGEEIIFQTNDTLSNSGDTSSKNVDTVTITDANRNQSGLIRKINPPIYQGAIIVCQGADNPTVRLAVTEAVAKITGIGTNCISVLKMK